jgi:UDP-glucose 4-epimerase
MSKILLTGGAGYIGTHIAVCAQAAGLECILLDNFSNSDRGALVNLGKIIGSHPVCITGDVRDSVLITEVIAKHDIDAVIHLAGLKSVEESVSNPELYFDNNVKGTRSLLAGMERAGIFRLVFSSSATVYGEPKYLPLDEEHPIRSVNPYADSKIQVEKLLASKCEKDGRWQVACLRYFNPVGSHPSGLLGDNPKALRANLMPMIARVLTGKLEFLEIYGNNYDTPDGTCLRDYIHIMDLAEGHINTLNFLEENSGCTAINLGTGHGVSVLDLVRTFEQVIGGEIPLRMAPRRPGDVPACYANCDKAKAIMNWEATRNLATMCESTWEWCKRIET